MAKVKQIKKIVKLQIPAAKASPAPPIGPVLGQAQVNIGQFCTQFNEKTKDMAGSIIPVVITVYEDRSYSFITKTPPASDLIRKAAGVTKGSDNSKKNIVGKITQAQAREIGQTKLPDLNAYDVEHAAKIIAGTARNMGISVED